MEESFNLLSLFSHSRSICWVIGYRNPVDSAVRWMTLIDYQGQLIFFFKFQFWLQVSLCDIGTVATNQR